MARPTPEQRVLIEVAKSDPRPARLNDPERRLLADNLCRIGFLMCAIDNNGPSYRLLQKGRNVVDSFTHKNSAKRRR